MERMTPICHRQSFEPSPELEETKEEETGRDRWELELNSSLLTTSTSRNNKCIATYQAFFTRKYMRKVLAWTKLAAKYKTMGKKKLQVKRQQANSTKLSNMASVAKEGATIAASCTVKKMASLDDSFQKCLS
jgi:hypothetical protein